MTDKYDITEIGRLLEIAGDLIKRINEISSNPETRKLLHKLYKIKNELTMMEIKALLLDANKRNVKGLNEFTGINGEFTLEEIGLIYGITRERVRQIETLAIKKLRHPKLARKLHQYRTEGGSDTSMW